MIDCHTFNYQVCRKVSPDITDVPPDTHVINASGKYVIPGGIDTHTHLQLSFMGNTTADDFYTGTRAALAGGTTMISEYHDSHYCSYHHALLMHIDHIRM